MKIYTFHELASKELSQNIVSYPFILDTDDIRTKQIHKYCIEFHCIKGQLFVPRMYPICWQGKDFCFKKLLSSEGIYVNVRKILSTLLTIYDTQWGKNDNNYLIASGNYNFNEKKTGPSKKALLYKHYFEKSEFASLYTFFELTDITYIILRDPTIPHFYKACQLFAIYDAERIEQ